MTPVRAAMHGLGDPATIVLAGAIVGLLGALVHGRGLSAAGMRHIAGRHWALANLLLAAAALAMLARARWPQPLVYASADACELGAFLLLQRGLVRFTGQLADGAASAAVVLVVVAAAALPLLYALGAAWLRLLVYAAVAAWLLGASARSAMRGLGAEFGREAAVAVAAPCALGAFLELLRVALAHWTSVADVADALRPTAENVALQWAAFTIMLGLNFGLAVVASARQLRRVHDLSLRDPLTGLWNRRAVALRLQRELAARRRHGLPLALISFDLDHFKQVNDRHGHAGGDAALCHVAQLLGAACRDGDLLARSGGEEFCVLMPYTALEGACLMAERLRATLENAPLAWHGATLALSGSFGVASVERAADDGHDLFERADRAMYAAKQGGRNGVCAG